MPPRDQDPPHDPDEPYVRRWPRALRLIFLLVAGATGWALVMALLWTAWRRFVG